jgi:hypothetical protein
VMRGRAGPGCAGQHPHFPLFWASASDPLIRVRCFTHPSLNCAAAAAMHLPLLRSLLRTDADTPRWGFAASATIPPAGETPRCGGANGLCGGSPPAEAMSYPATARWKRADASAPLVKRHPRKAGCVTAETPQREEHDQRNEDGDESLGGEALVLAATTGTRPAASSSARLQHRRRPVPQAGRLETQRGTGSIAIDAMAASMVSGRTMRKKICPQLPALSTALPLR